MKDKKMAYGGKLTKYYFHKYYRWINYHKITYLHL